MVISTPELETDMTSLVKHISKSVDHLSNWIMLIMRIVVDIIIAIPFAMIVLSILTPHLRAKMLMIIVITCGLIAALIADLIFNHPKNRE